MFSPYFVAGLPPGLQDEMVAIATLLKTRCEANQVGLRYILIRCVDVCMKCFTDKH